MRNIITLLAVLFVGFAAFAQNQSHDPVPTDWQFGVQAYSFRKFSFFDTVEKSAALGLKSIEMYPGQKIGGELTGATGHGMDADSRKAVKEKLNKHQMRVAAYGVVNAKDEAGWQKIFEFAKEMEIGTVIIEPPEAQLATVSKLCDEFKINAAIHNHAKPSKWWDPKTVKTALEKLSKRVGICPDIGHWTRSGLDTAECMKAMEGRILAIHLKDVILDPEKGKGHHEWVALGKGTANVAGVMAELLRQQYKGPVSIEHEGHANDPYLPVKQSVRFVRENVKLSPEKLAAGETKRGDQTLDIADISRGLDPLKDAVWTGEPQTDAPKQVKDDVTKDYSNLVNSKGKATASAKGYPNESSDKAFDGDSKTKYCVLAASVWLQYTFPDGAKKKIAAYTICSGNDAPERDPKDWKLLGSTDGEKFEVLDERKGETFKGRHQKRLFKIKKPGAYSVYRLDIAQNAGKQEKTQLSEVELLVKKK